MSVGILGTKIGMTQVFDPETGNAVPVSVIHAGPCVVTQIKAEQTDGYQAIQLGYGETKEKHINKPKKGHLAKAGINKPLKHLREFRVSTIEPFELGQILEADWFESGQLVDVTGTSIGKGFAGYQKRHNFKRGAMSHGSKNHRLPGSTGAGTTPGRTYPGKKMAGREGAKKVTIRKLEIIKVDVKSNLLLVKGAVPGKPGNLLTVTPSNIVSSSQQIEINRRYLEDVYRKYQLMKKQPETNLEENFKKLAAQWRSETIFLSSMTKILEHPAYLKIVEMGLPVIPLILDELKQRPYFWFTALTKITGENPIPDEERGNIDKMTKIWLNFAEKKGYI